MNNVEQQVYDIMDASRMLGIHPEDMYNDGGLSDIDWAVLNDFGIEKAFKLIMDLED